MSALAEQAEPASPQTNYQECIMKTLLSATAVLSLMVGTAFAETGENFDWAFSPNVPVRTAQPARSTQLSATMPASNRSAVITYGMANTYYVGGGSLSAPVNWGGG